MWTYSPTNTPTDPVTPTRSLVPEPLNFNSDFRVVSEKPGEVVLTNITNPLSQPETIRIAYSEIPDVFKGALIEPPSASAPNTIANRRGVTILVQIQSTGVESVSGIMYPIQAHLVLKVPIGGLCVADSIKDTIERLLGGLYETGAETMTNRVAALIRGSITPPDL